MKYAVGNYYKDGEAFLWIPDLNARFASRSKTPEKAKVEARSALLAEMQTLINDRKPVPLPSATTDHIMTVFRDKKFKDFRAGYVRIPVHVAAKIKAYTVWLESGMNEPTLADKSGMSKSGVRGLWDLSRSSELKNIVSVCEACGYDMDVTIKRKERSL